MKNQSAKTFVVSLVVVIVGAFLLLQSGCNKEQETNASPPPASLKRVAVAIGFRPGVVVDLALMQAVERGDFSKNGFDVELKPYGRADLIFAALKSGEIQGSLGVPLEPLLEQAANGNYPCKGYLVWYFTADQNYDGLIVRADSGVNGLEDLKGKAVGSHPSKQVTYFVTQFLPDSTVKPYNPAAPLTSLDSGDMAGAYVLEPFISIAKAKSGKYRVLELNAISRRVFAGERVPAALSVLSAQWVDAHASEAAEFVRLARAAYLEDSKKRDTNAVVNILTQPKFGGYASEVAVHVAEPASSLPENLDKAQFDRFTAALKKGSLLSGEVAFDKLLYVPAAK